MDTLSVIIPTLWKSKEITLQLLKGLSDSEYVSEIILIDNSKNPPDLGFFKKIIHVKEYRNTYYCPAINKGFSLCSSNYICVSNDDVVIKDFMHHISLDFLSEEVGMLGLSGFVPNFKYDPKRETKIKRAYTRGFGYACVYYIHRKSWIDIPKGLRIWYGDDYQFNKIHKNHYEITNPGVIGVVSATSDDSKFDFIKKEDFINYKKLINHG